jgi:hypothetical protein
MHQILNDETRFITDYSQTEFHIESRLANQVPHWELVLKSTYIAKSTRDLTSTFGIDFKVDL